METRDSPVSIAVDGQHVEGTLVTPARLAPGALFVHGWGGSQRQDLAHAHELAALGCICLTFDLRGHALSESQHDAVTREDGLRDLLAAYDMLAGRSDVDASAIAVVGASYGGYLAAILSSLRSVRWLALRAPALYEDENWMTPKRRLDRSRLDAYRRRLVNPQDNRALRSCAAFRGDVLIVESERDDTVPHAVITSYREAFGQAHSLTYRVIKDADHGLSGIEWQQAYTSLLINWATEMVIGAREHGPAPGVHVPLTAPQPTAPSRGQNP